MIEVAIYGAGRLGTGVAARLAHDPGVTVRGPSARDRGLLNAGADVVLIATATLLHEVADDIRAAVRAGSNVLVSAEEAADPWAVDPVLASEVDALARDRGVTVLGAGLNPGFLFDTLVLTLTALHPLPTFIEVARVVDLSGFGPAVRARLGLGVDRATFEAGLAAGSILGHAGFRQSMSVVARALGIELERVDGTIEPTFGEDALTDGFVQEYTGTVAGSPWYRARFTGYIAPTAAGLTPSDRIAIVSDAGTTESVIEPGVPSLSGSVSVIANSVRRVVAAPAGWLTVADLPPAHPMQEEVLP